MTTSFRQSEGPLFFFFLVPLPLVVPSCPPFVGLNERESESALSLISSAAGAPEVEISLCFPREGVLLWLLLLSLVGVSELGWCLCGDGIVIGIEEEEDDGAPSVPLVVPTAEVPSADP